VLGKANYAAGVPVVPGVNTLTNVFTDIFGRSVIVGTDPINS